jgi:hypothetical protein
MAAKKPSALLLVDSIDRYVKPVPGVPSNFADIYLETKFNSGATPVNPFAFNTAPTPFDGNRFLISANQPLIYGAIDTISVSQVQFNYQVPTFTEKNNVFWLCNLTALLAGQPLGACVAEIFIPVGWYNVIELCAMIEYVVNDLYGAGLFTPFTFRCVPNSSTIGGQLRDTYQGISWYVEPPNPPGTGSLSWCFINPFDNADGLIDYPWFQDRIAVLRTLETLNISKNNCGFPSDYLLMPPTTNRTNAADIKQSPPFKLLYTAYVDILSNKLTKYQDVKDTDTKALKQTNQIARVYLAGQGSPQQQIQINAIGSSPFTVVATLTNTKVIQWDPDEAVYELDFELRDQYGDLLYWQSDIAPTEFQLTFLCSE